MPIPNHSSARRILVTGGAGFIGSHLVDYLVSNNAGRVVVLDNLKRGRAGNLAPSIDRIEFIEGDIRDRAVVRRAAEGADLIFHLAAQSNVLGAVEDIDYSFTTNVGGTLEVLRAAKECGARRLVFTSSREVYGEVESLPVPETAPLSPKNAYGASKAAGEMYCRIFSGDRLSVRVLRLANVYGARDFDRVIPIFLGQALENEPLTLFGGKQILDFIWIDAVIEALLKASEALDWTGPVNVGSGKGTTILDLARHVVSKVGSASQVRIEPQRNVEVSQFTASTERMREKLGIVPPADPLAGLPGLIEWMRKARRRRPETMRT